MEYEIHPSLNRKVRLVESSTESTQDNTPLPFHAFLHIPNIILLGDPGAGKSHTFKYAAAFESVVCRGVRNVITDLPEELVGQTLYMDALDEYRSKGNEQNFILNLISHLKQAKRPPIRLSCRVADWHGEGDLTDFKDYFMGQEWAVLQLEPLSHEEISTIIQSEGIGDVDRFMDEAFSNSVEDMLYNPQTLTMLAKVVFSSGSWPKTKKELYEKASVILLKEHSTLKSRTPLGQYSSEELLLPAGAVCSTMLISNVAGISLLADSLSDEYPCYKALPLSDNSKTEALLSRRLFVSVDTQHEAFACIHKTIAEFLSARWIAEQVEHRGLPLGRVLSLIEINNQVASSLRGLYAWLAIFLQHHTDRFIQTEPYGVLKYGDVASLSTNARKRLFTSLVELAESNPWFRDGDWGSSALGALSGDDMVGEFKDILESSESGFHLKSLVLDSLLHGPKINTLQTTLVGVVSNSDEDEYLRIRAFNALCHNTDNGELLATKIYREKLSTEQRCTAFRSKALAEIYPHIDSSEVIQLFRTLMSEKEDMAIGELRELLRAILVSNPEIIVDGIASFPDENIDCQYRGEREVSLAYEELLVACLEKQIPTNDSQFWKWLCAYEKFHHYGYGEFRKRLNELLQSKPDRLKKLFSTLHDQYCQANPLPSYRDTYFWKFREWVEYPLTRDWAYEILESKESLSEGDVELFIYMMPRDIYDNKSRYYFEKFFDLAENNSQLIEARDKHCCCILKDYKYIRKDHFETIKRKEKRKAKQKKDIENLQLTRESIETGYHINNLTYLADVYTGHAYESNRGLLPIERLQELYGDDLTLSALNGFIALAKRDDYQSIDEIIETTTKRKYYGSWCPQIIGMDLMWASNPTLDTFSVEQIEKAMVILLGITTYEYKGNNSSPTKRAWPKEVYISYPENIYKLYMKIASVFLSKKHYEDNPVINKLSYEEVPHEFSSRVAFDLLNKFPQAKGQSLSRLIELSLRDSKYHRPLGLLAKSLLERKGLLRGKERQKWVALAYVMGDIYLVGNYAAYAKKYPELMWRIGDYSRQGEHSNTHQNYPVLSLIQKQKIVCTFAPHFDNVDMPRSSCGTRNLWDAAQYIRNVISSIANVPSQEASDILSALSTDSRLLSYRNHIKHALSNQRAVRCDNEYQHPSFNQVVETLQGGKPSNIADLHALAFDLLHSLKKRIVGDNRNLHDMFWNEPVIGSYKKVKKKATPRTENSCRDAVLTLIDRDLSAIDVIADPERQMAKGKRCDIFLQTPELTLPIEAKRNYHDKIWSACINQLDRWYTCDPKAQGYGIYLIFWFGGEYVEKMKVSPDEKRRPQSAGELEKMLIEKIPSDKKEKLSVVVIDVSQ